MHSHTLLLSLALLLPTLIFPAAAGTTCSPGTRCTALSPCCSEFGYCGTGSFCLGGCDPFNSYTALSCAPAPVCKSQVYSFSNFSSVSANATGWNGDPGKIQWTLDKGSVGQVAGGVAALLLTKEGGTRISLTREILYGTITATMQVSKWAGVVTAFITMSGIRDEIDWEFPGVNVSQGQTNYFWEGVQDFTHGNNVSVSSDRSANFHDYTIQWTPDTLTWLVDGKALHSLTRASTLNTTTGQYQYPQTPSRIQLSVWPGGAPGSSAGTVAWAGGAINYNDPDFVSNGYFYALVKSVNVTCYDDPGSLISYEYLNNSTLGEPAVAVTSDPTVIYSQQGTGLDMTAGKPWFSGSNDSGVLDGAAAIALGKMLLTGLAAGWLVAISVGWIIAS